MDKLLVICGPTATGKTSLAIDIAKKFKGEIISADSRQVYRDLDIGTGKDLPENRKLMKSDIESGNKNISYYSIEGTNLWGYDLVDPKSEFSVSHYIEIGDKIVGNIIKKGKLPILTGGTGLYIRGVVDGIPSAAVPRDIPLRNRWEKESWENLLKLLSEVAPEKASLMNPSDVRNPRRLIRAIEVARYSQKNTFKGSRSKKLDTLFVGLNAPKDFIYKKIEDRVKDRIGEGVELEIRHLLKSGVKWDMQSMNTLGYKEWKEYFEGKMRKEDVIQKWIQDERKYAKRQMTWFKKDGRIKWFDITLKDWKKDVDKLVRKWHN